MKIIIKNYYTQKEIFAHEQDENSIKITVLKAIESRADLSGADLSDADLSDANLSGANLSDANLSRADLSDADLSDADLSRADLSDADLTPIKNDMFLVLLNAIPEIENLKIAIINGQIDGSTYSGACACLCGTLEKSKNEKITKRIYDLRDSNRPIERFFLAISKGDTPENSQNSKLALDWINEFQSLIAPL